MVTRKSSLPYPASPSTAAPKLDAFSPSGNLMVDSSDVPPVPHAPRSSDVSPKPHIYLDNDNPWREHTSENLRTDRPMPDFLKPRNGQPVQPQQTPSLQEIPNALRPGRSDTATPDDSSDSGDSRGFWEDEEPEPIAEDAERQSLAKQDPTQDSTNLTASNYPPPPSSIAPPPPTSLPPQPPSPALNIKRKPIAQTASFQGSYNSTPSHELSSNNPFRRPSSADAPRIPLQDTPDTNHWGDTNFESRSKGKEPMRPGMLKPSISDFSKLNIHSGPIGDPTALQRAEDDQIDSDPWKTSNASSSPAQPRFAPPPIPHQSHEQPDLIPVSSGDHLQNPWTAQRNMAPTPSPIPFDSSQKHVSEYNDTMLDRGRANGVIPLKDELSSLPNVNSAAPRPYQQSLIDVDDDRPLASPQKFDHASDNHDHEAYQAPPGSPPSKASRPKIQTRVLTEAELAKSIEDRNETYQIKHFNWFDHVSGRLRRSSMLTQNKNGPCPLLALVNALILGANDESQAALDDALRSREQVSLGLIIETLMYELMTRNVDAETELPDVDELNAFLMRLRTGMNANPRFVPQRSQAANLMDAENSTLHLPQNQRSQQVTGTFESTMDIKLYGAFAIPLVHGWLPEPGTEAADAFAKSAPTYEDAQVIQFGEEELEYKLTRGGLNTEEQRIWEDINSIKNFLAHAPTQLTKYGLNTVQQSLPSGSFAILFRNDHFSTIYKHPQSGQLFTLITDAGYADRDEIIWESLVDISGSRNEFFSGDFMPVSHHQATTSSSKPSQSDQHQAHLSVDHSNVAPLSPQEQQEQHDADFAMALQLQEEEEQRQRAETARRRRSGNNAANPATNNNTASHAPSHSSRNSSTGNIPITLTRTQQSRSDQPENRPSIPPRNTRANMPAVNRPADADGDDFPPTYEEAAKGKPYIPPMGSPLYSGVGVGTSPAPPAAQSPMGSVVQLTGTTSNVSNPGTSGNAGFGGQGGFGSGGGGPGNIHPPGINAPYSGPSASGPPRRQMRRWSTAYDEQNQQAVGQQGMPGAYYPGQRVGSGSNMGMASGGPGGGGGGGRRRDDRECIVM